MTTIERIQTILGSVAILLVSACAAEQPAEDAETIEQAEQGLSLPWEPAAFEPFSFTSKVSESGEFDDGDVRLDAVEYGRVKLPRWALQTVKRAKILVDDGVDVARGGHNLASGQGINSELDGLTGEGPATITPTHEDLTSTLDNFNLTSIVVTRENVGTASVEVSFALPVNTLFFWERGNATSPTTANSDLLVEALDWKGEVTASYKLLRSQYAPTGIAITTWNGSFASPSTPGGAYPLLGSVGLRLDGVARRFRLTSVQEEVGGTRDDGPDYKVIGALLPGFAR
jgi:hypothetical protein